MPIATSSFNYPYYAPLGLGAASLTSLAVIVGSLFAASILLLIMERFIPASSALRTFGIAFAIFGLLTFGLWIYADNADRVSLPIFAPHAMLSALWENYKLSYIDPTSGRTFDTERQDDSTSEGEGYTMLRAAWIDDQRTFDQSWQWTSAHLQKSNHLFAWLYGAEPNGTEGVLLSQNGQNSASDADTDIALALVFAYARWQDPAYLQAAMPIIHAIAQNEVVNVQGKPYLAPNDITGASSSLIELNPSYFSPYAYRIFAVLDPQGPWNRLIDTSYDVLEKSIGQPLGGPGTAGLPPDWVQMNTRTGALAAFPGRSTDFGYDAIRVPWRIALDWEWFKEPRAKAVLDAMQFLGKTWQSQGKLYATYTHAGTAAASYEGPATYGGTIGYFLVADPGDATAVYLRKLVFLYDPDSETWRLPLSYYDSNLVWFGMALYNNDLPNLFTALSSENSY